MEITYPGGAISAEDVVRSLCLTGRLADVLRPIVHRKEAAKKARELGLVISDEALQRFADEFRMRRGLHAAADMQRFLDSAGVTVEGFEDYCESCVLAEALADHLAGEDAIRQYFLNNRSDFDVATVSILDVAGRDLANELLMRVTEDGEDFHQLAREYSLDEGSKHAGGYVGAVRRADMTPEVAAKVFGAAAGEVVGPFEEGLREKVFRLVLVEQVAKAELNEQVRQAVKGRIVLEWVSQFLRGGVKVIA